MEQRAGIAYSRRLPPLTNRFGFRPRPLPRIMDGIGEVSVTGSNGATKSVVFYKNGDRYFQGHSVLLTQRRYRSFDSLLSELTRITKLPHGVRFVFTPTSGRRINALEQFEDGKSYVCSSFGKLRRIKYGHIEQRNPDNLDRTKMTRNLDNVRLKPLNYKPDTSHKDGNKSAVSIAKAPVMKPRLITVIRNGYKPRRVVKVLLNRRTAQNFEQVLNDVTSAVGVVGGSGVRKLYTTEGKQVHGLNDLLNSESDIFIAVGDEKFHSQDVEDILKDINVNANKITNKQQKQPSKNDHDKNKDASNKAKLLADESDQKSVASSRVSLRDDSDASSNYKTVQNHHKHSKSKHVKLPNISESEHSNHHTSNSGSSKIGHSESDSVLPPIDQNNNNQSTVSTNLSSKKQTKPESSKNVDSIKQQLTPIHEKKSVKNIKELFDVGKKLGDGNFAVVRECFSKSTNDKFALKIIDRSKMKGKEKMLDNEIKIMKRCKHQNIVKLFDDFHSETEIYLVMELVSGGDLFDAISSAVRFSEPEAANYVHDICSALHYLHKRKIVHRDLKPENLLVCHVTNDKKVLKLADFGLAMEVKEPIYTVCGTPTYVAPEILRESGYGLRVDMWAAGVITYIMLCGFPPFRSVKRRQSELFDLIQSGTYEFLSPYWDEVSDDAKDLVSNLLVVDIPKRYSAEQALSHKWVTGRISESRGTTIIEEGEFDEKEKALSKFKTAAISIQSVQRLKMLAADFQGNRGEKLLTHVK